MIDDIRREVAALDVSNRPVRKFGLLLCGVFLAWTGASWWRGGELWYWPAGTGVAFLLAGLVIPRALRLLYRTWMLLVAVLGWWTTRIILVLAYVVIATPTGWLLRLTGKDVLDERLEKDAGSYWKTFETVSDPDRYKKQY